MFETLKSKLGSIRSYLAGESAYTGARKMGKGKQLKAGGADADYEKFESYFYKDATVHGIITTIADSMAEAGIRYTHKDKDLETQANDLSHDYDLDQMIHSLTVTSMVFGNSFVVLDSEHDDFSFLDKLNPRFVSLSEEEGRISGWKYDDSKTKAEFTLEHLLHAPYMPLAGSTWGTSPLQPLTRILELKANIEINANKQVVRYMVPRYVYLLGKKGASVPQEVIDDFAGSLAAPDVAQDQVFENNIEIQTMGTQYKALHVGYIYDFSMGNIFSGFAFPDTFHYAKGSTEATAKIQMEIFNKKRIGGLQKSLKAPMKSIMGAIFEKEGIKFDSPPVPVWGPLSSYSTEAKINQLISLAELTDDKGNRVLGFDEIRHILKTELGFDSLKGKAGEAPVDAEVAA